MKMNKHGASFRDPSGFIFSWKGELFRQVNEGYAADYDQLMASGLYSKLVLIGRLIPHREIPVDQTGKMNGLLVQDAYKILQPDKVPFISYPYEWSFRQLKDAALATLSIQTRALEYGMSLKDASFYNIQFLAGKAILIDTLSFEIYQEGEPWGAYRQFCQHFLAPLALMAHRDIRLGQFLRIYIDGIPLDLASRLLPVRSWINFGALSHIHLHALAQKKYSTVSIEDARGGRKMSKQSLLAILDSLRNSIRNLKWERTSTAWSNYYDETNYSSPAFEQKKSLVADWASRVKPKLTWDLGANTGAFSRLASETGSYVVSWDMDPNAVGKNWNQVKKEKEINILPLLIDLTNPSPGMGWNNRERDSFSGRGPVDLVMALALIHHLAITNNLPLEKIAEGFGGWCKWLIIEFIPKEDSQVQKLLQSRKDIFPLYNRMTFEIAFNKYFKIEESTHIEESERWIYLMKAV